MSCNILQLCQSPIFWSSSSWWVGKCDLDWRTPDWRSLNVLHLQHLIRFAEFILKVCLCIHYTCCWLKDLVEVLEGQQRLMIGTPRGFRTEGMVLPRSILLCKRLLHVQGSFPCWFFLYHSSAQCSAVGLRLKIRISQPNMLYMGQVIFRSIVSVFT